jgi:hypothetical protein
MENKRKQKRTISRLESVARGILQGNSFSIDLRDFFTQDPRVGFHKYFGGADDGAYPGDKTYAPRNFNTSIPLRYEDSHRPEDEDMRSSDTGEIIMKSSEITKGKISVGELEFRVYDRRRVGIERYEGGIKIDGIIGNNINANVVDRNHEGYLYIVPVQSGQ